MLLSSLKREEFDGIRESMELVFRCFPKLQVLFLIFLKLLVALLLMSCIWLELNECLFVAERFSILLNGCF